MYFISGKGFFRGLGKMLLYVTGRYKMLPGSFILKRGRKISIHSEDTLIISLDNEVFYESELTVEVLPGAVQFVNAGLQDLAEAGGG